VKAATTLLNLRLCDLSELKGGVEKTALARYVRALRRELAAKGLVHFSPKVYFGDEWFSPEGVPAIAVPFYLATPRLKALETRMMREAEGGTPAWCMKLLRHEAGHCFDHAYRIAEPRKFTWPTRTAATTFSTCRGATPRLTRTRTSPRPSLWS
jgi:hypothetical protein